MEFVVQLIYAIYITHNKYTRATLFQQKEHYLLNIYYNAKLTREQLYSAIHW